MCTISWVGGCRLVIKDVRDRSLVEDDVKLVKEGSLAGLIEGEYLVSLQRCLQSQLAERAHVRSFGDCGESCVHFITPAGRLRL
jgi:hypothetical protein